MQRQHIVIASNFTADPVEESLSFWMKQLERPCQVSLAPFDQVFQQLFDPASLFGRNQSGINLLLVKPDNWARPVGDDRPAPIAALLEEHLAELTGALRAALERTPTFHLLVICPPAPSLLADPVVLASLVRAENELRAGLADFPQCQVVSSGELAESYPVESWYDAAGEALGQIPYSEEFFAALGTLLARRIRAAATPPSKVLVLDCDNTLWNGVCGEVGADGVTVDATLLEWQRFILRQRDSGMLLCLSSKNNEADVREVFDRRPDMPLRHENFIATRINWLPKSGNLKSLAAELRLGLDSFVFVDDSPFEVSEVRAGAPEVLALEFPGDEPGIKNFMRHGWAFDRMGVTAEDRRRTESYQENVKREGIRKQSADLDDFLLRLELEVDISVPRPDELARAAQLTQRTNQFNLSTIRRNEAELRQACEEDALECRVVKVRDRFGDYGLVGVILFTTEPDSLRVDSFLLSCRALGRRVEHRMLAALGRVARERGKLLVELPFVRTARNGPALEFLNGLGVVPGIVTGDQIFPVPVETALTAPSLPVAMVAPEGADESGSLPAPAGSGSAVATGRLLTRIFSELHSPDRILSAILTERRESVSPRGRVILAPRNQTERRMCEIWKQALHLAEVGVTENFFDLGGTSLAAVPLFSRIQKEFGPALTPLHLFQAPTIEQLAAVVAEPEAKATQHAGAADSLVPIQPSGTRPPLFCIHAGAGTILFYYPLARRLGPDQPVYGLQARGVEGRSMPHASVEAMAAQYLKEIKSVQPNGPYQLAGFCFGATIAFEMARQLERDGEVVSFLGSFDGRAPGYSRGSGAPAQGPTVQRRAKLPRWAGLFPRSIAGGIVRRIDTAGALPPRERLSYLGHEITSWVVEKTSRLRNRALAALTRRTGGPVPAALQRFRWYFPVNNMLALSRYRPAPYRGTMRVFTVKGRFQEPHLGWTRWAAEVRPIEVEGELRRHRDLMREPMISIVVEALQPLLAAQAASSTGVLV